MVMDLYLAQKCLPSFQRHLVSLTPRHQRPHDVGSDARCAGQYLSTLPGVFKPTSHQTRAGYARTYVGPWTIRSSNTSRGIYPHRLSETFYDRSSASKVS